MRFVIKNAASAYFTEMGVTETRDVTINGQVVGRENQYEPKFEAFRPSQAAHFDQQSDAESQMQNNPQWHGGASAFEGCTVEPTET